MVFFGAFVGLFAALPVLALIGYFADLIEEDERRKQALLEQAKLAREEEERKSKEAARLAKERKRMVAQAAKKEQEVKNSFPEYLQNLILEKDLSIDIAKSLLNHEYTIDDCQEICRLITKVGLRHDVTKICLENNLNINEITVICLQKWNEMNVYRYVNKVFSWDDCIKINSKNLELGMGMGIVKAMYGKPDQIDEKVLKTKTKHIWKYIEMKNNRKTISVKLTFDNNKLVGWER